MTATAMPEGRTAWSATKAVPVRGAREQVMRGISQKTLLRIFLRSYLVGAAYNMQGLQNVGFIYAMEPGLAAIHAGSGGLRAARERYIRHHNCHPFWAPLLVGIFLRAETDIAGGHLSPGAFMAVKDTATNTLSALGDSVFGGSMLVAWALACALLVALGQPGAAAFLSISLFLALQFFKVCIFAAGLRYGLSTLFWLRRWDLINWGDRLKLANAFLLALFLVQTMPPDQSAPLWAALIAVLCLAAWLTRRIYPSRIVIALAVMGGMILLCR